MSLHITVASILTLLALSVPVSAQEGESCKLPAVKVGFTASMCSHNPYTITLNGTQVTGTGDCTAEQWVTSDLKYAELEVDETYTLTVGADSCSTHINFVVPDGYKLEIDGIEAKSIDKVGTTEGGGDGSWKIVLREKCPCGGDGPGESPGPKRGSVLWQVGMGSLSNGMTAHRINLREEALSAFVYTPAALVYSPPGRTTEVDIVRNGDQSLRQVKAPQTLADIIVISATEYEIHYYRAADVGAKVGGLYTVTGQPFVKWRVKNPDVATTTRLQISKIQGAVTETSEYTWDAISDSWTLSTGNGTRIETATITYPTEGSRVETIVVKDNLAVLSSKVSRVYHTFAWGEELIQEVLDPDGAALKTVYSFYENQAESGKYTRLKSIVNPDGSWEKYDYDSAGNIVLRMRPWKDLSMAVATEENSHATRYTYSNSDGIITSLYTNLLSSTTEKIGGVIVRKTTYSRLGTTVDGHPAVIETQTAYSSLTESLVTVSTRYHATAPASLANRLISTEYPDGRKQSISYEKGNYIPNGDPGLSTFIPDTNGLAELETLVHGTVASPLGVPFKTTKETSVRDQYGNEVLRETYVYNGVAYERIGWIASQYDDRGHTITTRNHKGEVTTTFWNGDLKTSEIDSAGIEIVYTYDSVNRIKTQTKKGIAAAGGFPAQEDILTTFTYDADGHVIVETVSSNGLSLTTSRAYDKAGRLLRETDRGGFNTDQEGLTTTYAYANGGRTIIRTHPGGASQVSDQFLDGQSKSTTGSAVVSQYMEYGVNVDGNLWTQAFVGPAGLSSPRWTKTVSDWLGRTVSIEKPGFTGAVVVETSTYNSLGQLHKQTTTANSTKLIADRLYEYDELGQQTRTGSDIDNTGSLTLVSTDRLTETDVLYEKAGADWFRVSSSKTYLTDNNPMPVIETHRERLKNFALNGTEQTTSEVMITDVAGNTTRTTTAIDRSAKRQKDTTDTADSTTDAVSISINGLLQSSSSTTPQNATTYAYDSLARQTSTTDPRTGTSTQTFNTAGQLASTNDGAGTTTYEYYSNTNLNAGRLRAQVNALGKKKYFNYNSRGELIQTWGDATYPLEYVYDGYGQRTELHTFRGGQNWATSIWPASTTGPLDVTKWTYQEATGLLTQKLDPVLKGPTYTYDELGRVQARVWARGATCTYGYDTNTGELRSVVYSDNTPSVAVTYDRGGRQTGVTDAAGTRTRTFNVAGAPETEQITSGILDSVSFTAGYDSFLRQNSLQTSHGANMLSNQTYGYDVTSRLQTVTSGGQTATYTYYPGSGLLNTTTFANGTALSRTYDATGRLENITMTPASDMAQSYTYTYNNLSQRTRVTREDGSYWSYDYNDRGELVTGKKYWSDNSIVWGAQTEYGFDNVGNRITAKNGGNQLGGLRNSSYTSNTLNQYSQRTVPGAVDVTGTANAAATVTVNNQPSVRKNGYFYAEVPVDNTSGPVNQQINVVGARTSFGAGGEDAVTAKGGEVFLPASAETFNYDDDGNLTLDGRWIYAWDSENRLIAMESVGSVPADGKQRLEFAYDYMGRRIQKKVFSWDVTTATYQLHSVTKFVHDEWNLMAELDSNNVPIRNYTWGQDISGVSQDAGGIGGLLLINEAGNSYHVAYDGTGNVATLVGAGGGAVAASYEYDAFGNPLKVIGDYAGRNPFRFSTKYVDQESGMLNYGYRYYNPQTGRWISRDPMYEAGFNSNYVSFNAGSAFSAVDQNNSDPAETNIEEDLYTFTGNNPVNVVDSHGLYGRIIPESFKRDILVKKTRDVTVRVVNRVPVRITRGPWQENGVLKHVTQATVVYSEGQVKALDAVTMPRFGLFPPDHRGHIIGRQLGGPGIPDNLFSQSAAINIGEYKSHETHIRNYLDAHRCELELNIRLVYNVPPNVPIGAKYDGTKRWTKRLAYRPIKVIYRAKFSDGTEFNKDFSN